METERWGNQRKSTFSSQQNDRKDFKKNLGKETITENDLLKSVINIFYNPKAHLAGVIDSRER